MNVESADTLFVPLALLVSTLSSTTGSPSGSLQASKKISRLTLCGWDPVNCGFVADCAPLVVGLRHVADLEVDTDVGL